MPAAKPPPLGLWPLLALLAVGWGCLPTQYGNQRGGGGADDDDDDDDSIATDDDASSDDDDDATAGDDDATSDDDTTPGDDDATSDDDAASDDDTEPDDDATSDDDSHADDDVAPDLLSGEWYFYVLYYFGLDPYYILMYGLMDVSGNNVAGVLYAGYVDEYLEDVCYEIFPFTARHYPGEGDCPDCLGSIHNYAFDAEPYETDCDSPFLDGTSLDGLPAIEYTATIVEGDPVGGDTLGDVVDSLADVGASVEYVGYGDLGGDYLPWTVFYLE